MGHRRGIANTKNGHCLILQSVFLNVYGTDVVLHVLKNKIEIHKRKSLNSGLGTTGPHCIMLPSLTSSECWGTNTHHTNTLILNVEVNRFLVVFWGGGFVGNYCPQTK